jgi:Domain of unknown function (DUF4189)
MAYSLDQYMLARNMNTHGAIAYNSSTGAIGWSSGYYGEGAADAAARRALSTCPGGQIVACGQGSWFMVLALCPDRSWGTGQGGSLKYAKKQALRNSSRQGPGAQIVLVVNALLGLKEEYPPPTLPQTAAPSVGPDGGYRHPRGWGAVSISPSTSTFSYSFQELDEPAAINAARRNCRAADAQVPVSGFHVYLAIARSGNALSWGRGDSRSEAEQNAHRGLAEHDLTGQIVLVIHTLDGDITKPPKLVLDEG